MLQHIHQILEHIAKVSPLTFFSALALLGLCWGSFANVCIYRIPRGLSVITRRSHCTTCKSSINWYFNIPILGYILARGRCQRCHFFYSPRYLIVEILGAVLAFIAYTRHGISLHFLIGYAFLLTLLAISFIDIAHQIIPDELSIGGVIAGVIAAGCFHYEALSSSILGACLGAGILYLVGRVYTAITGIYGIGGGDIKLMGMIGAFLGAEVIFPTLFIGSLTGALLGIGPALLQKKGIRAKIPFGPSLCLGALCAFAFEHKLHVLAFRSGLP